MASKSATSIDSRDGNLTYAEAATYLGLKIGTLYAYVSQRRIPHVRLSGRLVLFRRVDLDAWMTSHAVEPK